MTEETGPRTPLTPAPVVYGLDAVAERVAREVETGRGF